MPDAASDIRQPNLLLRNDTILGVCEAIGSDVGINPNWLRLVFALSFYWHPVLVVGAYLALGLAVAFSRWLAPVPVSASAAPQLATHGEPVNDDADSGSDALAA